MFLEKKENCICTSF